MIDYKIDLSNLALIVVGSTRIEETKKAIYYCQSQCSFGITLYLTEIKNHDISNSIQYIAIDSILSKFLYQIFIIKDFPRIVLPYLNSNITHALMINWDGFVVNPQSWNKDFLNYDYIGAPWPWIKNMCGNGGFCLKSKKFLECQYIMLDRNQNINVEHIPEDIFLSINYRENFENMKCLYSDASVGYKFSTEYGGYNSHNSFGFHDFNQNPQFRYLIE